CGVAYNSLQADRRKTRSVEPLDAEPQAPASPDPDEAMWVRQALAQIDAGDREILMLREYEQLSYQEIADLRRLSLNTVRSRLFRARMALKSMLMPDAGESVKVDMTVAEHAVNPEEVMAYLDGELPAERAVVVHAHMT